MTLGHVYVINTTLTRPPKKNIVLCVDAKEMLFFWFNTLPRPHGVGQLACSAADHRALDHP
jgi:hypothetical protein